MDVNFILRAIDAEIKKLELVRSILERLLKPNAPVVKKPKRIRVKQVPALEPKPEPRLIVLSPKERREYRPRTKPTVIEPKALAAPVSSAPVVVPRAPIRKTQKSETVGTTSALEAAMRRKLLG